MTVDPTPSQRMDAAPAKLKGDQEYEARLSGDGWTRLARLVTEIAQLEEYRNAGRVVDGYDTRAGRNAAITDEFLRGLRRALAIMKGEP